MIPRSLLSSLTHLSLDLRQPDPLFWTRDVVKDPWFPLVKDPSDVCPFCPSSPLSQFTPALVPSRRICIGWSTGLRNAASRPSSSKSTSVY